MAAPRTSPRPEEPLGPSPWPAAGWQLPSVLLGVVRRRACPSWPACRPSGCCGPWPRQARLVRKIRESRLRVRARFRPPLRRLRPLPGPCVSSFLALAAPIALAGVAPFLLVPSAFFSPPPVGKPSVYWVDRRVAFRNQIFGQRRGRQRKQGQDGGDGDRDGSQAHVQLCSRRGLGESRRPVGRPTRAPSIEPHGGDFDAARTRETLISSAASSGTRSSPGSSASASSPISGSKAAAMTRWSTTRSGSAVWWVLLVGVLVGALPRVGAEPAGDGRPGDARRLRRSGTALSLIWTESTERTAAELARALTYLGVFALVLCVRAPREPRRLVAAVAAAIVLVAVLALLSRLHPAWFPSADQTARLPRRQPRTPLLPAQLLERARGADRDRPAARPLPRDRGEDGARARPRGGGGAGDAAGDLLHPLARPASAPPRWRSRSTSRSATTACRSC